MRGTPLDTKWDTRENTDPELIGHVPLSGGTSSYSEQPHAYFQAVPAPPKSLTSAACRNDQEFNARSASHRADIEYPSPIIAASSDILEETLPEAITGAEIVTTDTGSTIQLPQVSEKATTVSPTADSSGQMVSILVPFGGETPVREDGIMVFIAPDGDAAPYIQPAQDGVRFLTAIKSPSAGSEFSYTVEGVEDDYIQRGSIECDGPTTRAGCRRE